MKYYILVLLFISTGARSQVNNTEVDSLLNVIRRQTNDTLKVINYARINSIIGKSNPKQGNEYLQKGLSIVKKMNWGLGYSMIYNAMGSNYGNMADQTALNYYLRSLEYSDHKNRLKELTTENYLRLTGVRLVSLNNVTIIYIDQKNIEKATYYNEMAFKVSEENTVKKNKFHDTFLEYRAVSFTLLSDINVLKKDTISAIRSLKEGLTLIQNLERPNREAVIWSSLGELTQNKQDRLAYFFKAKDIWDKSGYEDINYITNLNWISQTYLDLYKSGNNGHKDTGLLKKAEQYLDMANTKAIATHAVLEIIKTYKNLSELKKLQGDLESAYNYNVRYHALNDSIFSQEKKNALAALESQNAMRVKDKDIEMKRIKLEAQETQNWLLIIGLVLVSFFVGILLYQNRLRKSKNEKLEEANRIKIRFFNILNHDLRSPVGDLVNFLHLKKDNPDLLDTETTDRLEQQTMDAAENLLASMEDLLLWSKGQMSNFAPAPKIIAIAKIFHDIEILFADTKHINLTFSDTEKLTVFTDENYLKTITRNLSSNAIKALVDIPNAHIEWRAYSENNTLIISITDNGPGGTSEQFRALYDDKEVVGIKTGLGLHLVRDMAKAIGCRVEIDSEVGVGTSIRLIFNKTQP
jgi:signal transduction histidine kinase